MPRRESKTVKNVGASFVAGALAICLCSCAGKPQPTLTAAGTPTSDATADPGVLAPRTPPDEGAAIPALATRTARIKAALQDAPPVLLLDESLADLQKLAQDLAVRDQRVLRLASDSITGEPMRTEVLGIRRAGPGDLTDEMEDCMEAACYRVELYNHGLNSAVVAIVDVSSETVIAVNEYPGAQPDLPPHLVSLAQQIAANAPEVVRALGAQPSPSDAVMAGTKTALNETRCERSRHLCVAPTFLQGDRALWAIVDLTDGVLVGTRWTALGKSGAGPVVTERRLQDDVVSALFCERETELARGDWAMNYHLTSSDGLRVSNVSFAGKSVLVDAKLVDWHVSYSGADAFGYSDAVGCPTFSQAAVVAHGGPEVGDLLERDAVAGFALTQDFMGEGWPAQCHYFYRQRFEFYDDGRFRVVAGNHGRGCGTDGTYRPVLRIAISGDSNTFGSWDGGAWRDWAEEGFERQGAQSSDAPGGHTFRITDPAGDGYFVDPGRGQFGDGGRGDDALLYVTLHKPGVDEGQADLITIGPCCNTDHRQGPERFIEPQPESIAGGPLVLWYVAQLENDDTPGSEYCWAESVLEGGVYVPKAYPCYAGPMFVPIGRQ